MLSVRCLISRRTLTCSFTPARVLTPRAVAPCTSAARTRTDDSARNGRSMAEQESDSRDLAARQGLTVVAVFREREGTGASVRSRKPRPAWDLPLCLLWTMAGCSGL